MKKRPLAFYVEFNTPIVDADGTELRRPVPLQSMLLTTIDTEMKISSVSIVVVHQAGLLSLRNEYSLGTPDV
jgi:hypothetical protein